MPAPGADAIQEAVQAALGTVHLELILPEVALTVTGLLALVLGATLARGRQWVVAYTTLLGVLASLAGLVLPLRLGKLGPDVVSFSGLLVQDGFAIFFKYLFLIATGLVILLSLRYLDEERMHIGEYYALLCFATLGMMFMASGQDLITIYVGLELMALSIYVLVGFIKGNRRSNEAAMKYFILGAFSSAFFIYGISLFYGVAGSTSLEALRSVVATESGNWMLTLALIFLSVGLGFKVAAVPFHAWAPDAYEGAPTPITAYVSVASKSAAFAILLRILLVGLYDMRASWTPLLWVLAAATMTFGNVCALVQDNVKRMLAYSSIAHAGYVLLGVLAAGASVPPGLDLGPEAGAAWLLDLQSWAQGGVLVYLFAYTFMNLGAFAVITMLRRGDIVGDQVKDFAGLSRRAPWAAVAMSIFLLSLGGLPPTAGFVGKLMLFSAAIKAEYYALAVIAVLNTAISIYFYFRIVVMMWLTEPREQPAYADSWELRFAVALALVGTLAVGILPGRFLQLAQGSILEVTGGLGPISRLPAR